MAEPFVGELEHPFRLDISRHGENGIRGDVVTPVEGRDVGERRFADVVGRQSDGRPPVGMHLISQRPQQQPLLPVRLVEVTLLVLLDHHRLLRRELLRRDVEPRHPVRFQPEGRLDVVLGQRHVVIGVIVVGKGVVLAAGHLHRHVEIGHEFRSPEHQMFEKMGESRPLRRLVAGPHPIEHIDRRKRREPVAVGNHPQSVPKRIFRIVYHDISC